MRCDSKQRLETLLYIWDGDEVVHSAATQDATTIKLPQHRLFQLALGYIGAESYRALADVTVQGETRLFRALFTKQLPYLWSMDHF